jgi:glycosyltransferase involved in cell wall biosynthesis
MSKILYISHTRDESGWSRSAIDTILAMDSVNIDIVPRCVNFAGKNPALPNRILELENKDPRGADICWQAILPEYAEPNGSFKLNVVEYFSETDSIPDIWVKNINLFDLAIVHSKASAKSSKRSGVTIPIEVLPVPIDTTKFHKQYPVTNLRQQFPTDFLFLAVGEWNERKDYESLIKAFHIAFVPEDPVQLVIKTGIPGKSPQEAAQIITSFCNEVKTKLRLYPNTAHYKNEILVLDRLPDEVMCSLYKDCNSFVSTSHGEGLCLPALDALGFGLPIIAPEHTAFMDYLYDAPNQLIIAYDTPCYGEMNQLPYLHTARENWCTVDIDDLVGMMQFLYKNPQINRQNWIDYSNKINEFSYENVGNKIKSLLERNNA